MNTQNWIAEYSKRLKSGEVHKTFKVRLSIKEANCDDPKAAARSKAEWKLSQNKSRNRYSDFVYDVVPAEEV